MYTIIKNVIENTTFNPETITEKINAQWVQDYISDDERLELLALAMEKADPENGNKSLQEQIDELFQRVTTLENATNTTTEAPVVVKYNISGLNANEIDESQIPDFVEPANSTEYYVYLDTCRWNGVCYVMTREGKKIPYNPTTYPIGWTKLADYIAGLTAEDESTEE